MSSPNTTACIVARGCFTVNAKLVHVLTGPLVQVVTVECLTLLADRNLTKVWPHVSIERVPAHAKIGGRYANPYKSRLYLLNRCLHSDSPSKTRL